MARGAYAVRDLSTVVLTDWLSDVKLQSLLAGLRDKKVHESLEMIAAQSTLLDLPSEVKSVDLPPSTAEQQRMLSAAADYLAHVIPGLPNLFCDPLQRIITAKWLLTPESTQRMCRSLFMPKGNSRRQCSIAKGKKS
jgi:hypothetical protein